MDVYAYALVLWEMLTRSWPWKGEEPEDIKEVRDVYIFQVDNFLVC
jgi:hypothetical protein